MIENNENQKRYQTREQTHADYSNRNETLPSFAGRQWRRNGITGAAAQHWERQCPNANTRPQHRVNTIEDRVDNDGDDTLCETLNSRGGQQN